MTLFSQSSSQRLVSIVSIVSPSSHHPIIFLFFPSVSPTLSSSREPSCLSVLVSIQPCDEQGTTLLLIFVSNSFTTWLSSVMTLYFPDSCTSPFLFYIGTITVFLLMRSSSCSHFYITPTKEQPVQNPRNIISSSFFPLSWVGVLPATSSPPHLIFFSILLCLLSSSSSLPLLLSSHLS